MVAPRSPRDCEKITILTYTHPNLLFDFIGPCNLHYLLFSEIGALLCHHPHCFPSQSQTLFGMVAGRPPILSRSQVTLSARKYLPLCWREGWGVDVVVLSTFWNTYFSRLVKIIIRLLQLIFVFFLWSVFIYIYFLTSWIFIPLLVFSLLRYSLLVTALLCLVTPVPHVLGI